LSLPDLREVVSFLGVGGTGFVVDVGSFNLLHAALGPAVAKVVAVTVAMAVTYAGSMLVTWRGSDRGVRGRQFTLFVMFNLVGLGISEVALGTSHLMGFTSRLADNLSANGIGLALGTLFRFWAYRTYVFATADRSAEAYVS
jgi:putative flippase GtrA